MKETFENKLDRIVDGFVEFSNSDEYLNRYNCPIHINYDVRQALEGIEVELRERIRVKEGKRFVNIPLQFIIGFILTRFISGQIDYNDLLDDYFSVRAYREDVKFEVCSSKLSKQIKTNIDHIIDKMRENIDTEKFKRNQICLRYFIDYVVNKFVKEYFLTE